MTLHLTVDEMVARADHELLVRRAETGWRMTIPAADQNRLREPPRKPWEAVRMWLTRRRRQRVGQRRVTAVGALLGLDRGPPALRLHRTCEGEAYSTPT